MLYWNEKPIYVASQNGTICIRPSIGWHKNVRIVAAFFLVTLYSSNLHFLHLTQLVRSMPQSLSSIPQYVTLF